MVGKTKEREKVLKAVRTFISLSLHVSNKLLIDPSFLGDLKADLSLVDGVLGLIILRRA